LPVLDVNPNSRRDPDSAARSKFGGLIASGWLTAALVMRLIAEARPFGDTEVLGMAVENLRWHLPVRPGDTLSAEMEVVVAALRSRIQPLAKSNSK
jgi:acyl dehydratase